MGMDKTFISTMNNKELINMGISVVLKTLLSSFWVCANLKNPVSMPYVRMIIKKTTKAYSSVIIPYSSRSNTLVKKGVSRR